jgi:hypothetical protein
MHGFVPVELTGRSHLVRDSAGLPRHEAHEGRARLPAQQC